MESFIHEFGIDVRLLLAQLLNFAILVFVLGYFLYKPILHALDERRKKIEDGVEFSERAKKELENVEILKKESIREAEIKSLEIVQAAQTSAKQVEGDILATAEAEKEKIIAAGQGKLHEDEKKMQEEFYSSASSIVGLALEKVLAKRGFEKEEKELVDAALKELRASK